MRKNTQNLKGIRCPKCFETERFVIQMTVNLIVTDDGAEHFASQPELDHFPGRPIDEEDGLHDEDPISCHNRHFGAVCGHYGTVGEFRTDTVDKSVDELLVPVGAFADLADLARWPL